MPIRRLPATGDRPRSTGVPDSVRPGGAADSAGFPWAGRQFSHHDTAFAGDDGATPEAYTDAVRRVRAAADGPRDDLARSISRAIEEISRVRLLVPLLTDAGDLGTAPDGRTVDKTQELSIVTVRSPDGRTALPLFSSVEAMREWNTAARPIPVPAPQAALAAAQGGTDLIIIDPGSDPTEFGVRRTQLRALALGEPSQPAWARSDIRTAFELSAAEDPAVAELSLHPADPAQRLHGPEVEVRLALRAGLQRADLDGLLEGLQTRWAQSSAIADAVDSLRVAVRSVHDGTGQTRD